MITEICRETNNIFNINDGESGTFKIQDGVLTGNRLIYPINTYLAITRRTARADGSLLNSGIYKVMDDKITLQGDNELQDEVWSGSIYPLAIPPDFIKLAERIKAFTEDPTNKPSTNASESVGFESRSRTTNSKGAVLSWQAAFADELTTTGQRRMFRNPDIRI